jgi:uncharacterized membrane protein YhaH (DUF805 family)
MDWGNLFFKFNGRTNRAKFWIACLVILLINVILFLLSVATDQNGIFQAVNGMLSIVILICGIAVGVKRLHDRNKSGWYLLLFYFVPGVLAAASVLIGEFMEDAAIIANVLAFVAFAIVVWAFVELGCLRGTIGVNQYGPDPVAPATIPPVRLPT